MGNKHSDKEARRRLRRRLEAQGLHPNIIDRRVARLAARQLDNAKDPRAAAAAERIVNQAQDRKALQREHREARDHAAAEEAEAAARQRARWEAEVNGDSSDAGYRPATVDALLTGPARATGVAATAVRRKSALTRHEHSRLEARQ